MILRSYQTPPLTINILQMNLRNYREVHHGKARRPDRMYLSQHLPPSPVNIWACIIHCKCRTDASFLHFCYHLASSYLSGPYCGAEEPHV